MAEAKEKAPKQEAPKQEAPKQEAPKQEAPKAVATATETPAQKRARLGSHPGGFQRKK